jgi:DNA-binding transcriptional LysR family regulator
VDIHLLRTFVAAFEEANFTRAAKRINATQPGVSTQIAVLEAEVGTSLFDRNPRCMAPTVAGRHLYPLAVRLIHDLNCAKQELRSLSGKATRRVAVGVPPLLGEALTALLLPQFLESYPLAEVQIVEEHGSTLTSLIENREIDVAFLTHMDARPAFNCRKLFSDTFVVASGRRSGLVPGEPVRLDIEPHHKVIFPSRLRSDLYPALEEPLRSRSIVAARSIEMNSLSSTLELVAKSSWIAVLPAVTACRFADAPGIAFSPIAGGEIGIDYYTVHARTEPISIAARAFIEMMAVEMNRARNNRFLSESSRTMISTEGMSSSNVASARAVQHGMTRR